MIYFRIEKELKRRKETNELIGKPFSLMQRIKMGGIGSKRFTISELSSQFERYERNGTDVDYGSIELRPKGIIVHFTDRLERYLWCIPYYKLTIYSTEHFSIHADGHFIRFEKNGAYTENKKFIDKLMHQRNEQLQLEYYG